MLTNTKSIVELIGQAFELALKLILFPILFIIFFFSKPEDDE